MSSQNESEAINDAPENSALGAASMDATAPFASNETLINSPNTASGMQEHPVSEQSLLDRTLAAEYSSEGGLIHPASSLLHAVTAQTANSTTKQGPVNANTNANADADAAGSDSDSSSASESESSSEESDSSDDDSDEDMNDEQNENENANMGSDAEDSNVPRTKNEVLEVSVPRVPDGFVIGPSTVIEPVGTIFSVGDRSVVILASKSGEYRVLDYGSIFCLEDKTLIGVLYETFGPVESPFYVVKFESEEELAPFQDKKGEHAFYVVSDSKYVLTKEFKAKGSDASNVNDEEVPLEDQEFSDDEQEARAKQKKKRKRRKQAPAIDEEGVGGIVPNPRNPYISQYIPNNGDERTFKVTVQDQIRAQLQAQKRALEFARAQGEDAEEGQAEFEAQGDGDRLMADYQVAYVNPDWAQANMDRQGQAHTSTDTNPPASKPVTNPRQGRGDELPY